MWHKVSRSTSRVNLKCSWSKTGCLTKYREPKLSWRWEKREILIFSKGSHPSFKLGSSVLFSWKLIVMLWELLPWHLLTTLFSYLQARIKFGIYQLLSLFCLILDTAKKKIGEIERKKKESLFKKILTLPQYLLHSTKDISHLTALVIMHYLTWLIYNILLFRQDNRR